MRVQVDKIAPEAKLSEDWLRKMLHRFQNHSPELNQWERSTKEWSKIFPRYPMDKDNFAHSFQPAQKEVYCDALQKFGVVVVKVLDSKTCDTTITAMFEEINAISGSRPNRNKVLDEEPDF